MSTYDEAVTIEVEGEPISATFVAVRAQVPGVLFVHGWGGSQQRYLTRAREAAALGCICLTFDLRGHAKTKSQFETVSRQDNLHDVVAAFDALAHHPGVDSAAKLHELEAYRQLHVRPEDSRALAACLDFDGDVLIVESEHDFVVPHPVIENYRAACVRARSLTYRVIEGADHGLSEESMQRAYTRVLIDWLRRMFSEASATATPTSAETVT